MSITEKAAEALRTVAARLDPKGAEIPDPTPVSIPVHLRKPESMDDRIRRIISHSISKQAEAQGLESFEEADDFDIPDDPIDPTTPWEQDFDLAGAQAVDRGVVAKPDLSPQRLAELKEKVSRKPKPPEKPKDPPTEG